MNGHRSTHLLRWLLFILYIGLFLIVPLGLLWNEMGWSLGLGLSILFLCTLGVNGTRRILRRLGARELGLAESPQIYSIVTEYCRRLGLEKPRIGILDIPSPNLVTFGFSRRNTWIILTTGLLADTRRDEVSALIAEELIQLCQGEIFLNSWLSQFVSFWDRFFVRVLSSRNRLKDRPYQLSLRLVLLYPFLVIPYFLLKSQSRPDAVDKATVGLLRSSLPLISAYKNLEASRHRHSLQVPLSVQHLFLLTPPAGDPLIRILLSEGSMSQRIRSLVQTYPLTCRSSAKPA